MSIMSCALASDGSITPTRDRQHAIPRLAQDPKISWVDDTEVVGDRIADEAPVFGHGFCQESHYGRLEVSECEVASVVGDVSVHDAPQPLDRVEMRAIGRHEMEG